MSFVAREIFRCSSPVNIGVGEDVTIQELADLVAGTVGYTGTIDWNREMPDGTPRKLLDVRPINALGWTAKIDPSEQGCSSGLTAIFSKRLVIGLSGCLLGKGRPWATRSLTFSTNALNVKRAAYN